MTNAPQLLGYALVTLLGAMSPGPDFAVVTRYSSLCGRRAGLLATLGVACGFAVYTAAAVFGLGAVITASPTVYTVIRLLGAVYLAYLGIRLVLSLRGRVAAGPGDAAAEGAGDAGGAASGAFVRGLGVNLLNPKSVVFLVALMPQFLPGDPTLLDRGVLGIVTVGIVLLWFVFVALGFSLLRPFFERPRARKVLDGATGVILLALGVGIALS